ncbi:hypothetical protein [Marinobacter sp.]|uniref:hypothetical protein n=1 Tax=Marinobacter sp. TaxID=50741 RepID=UPI00262004E3|nr:hypothetical protein [Marinobacter sp.]
MVEKPFEAIKAAVRSYRKTSHIPLSYSAHLEVAARLSTGAPSLNHLSAEQERYRDTPTPSIGEMLTALRSCEHLVSSAPVALQDADDPEDYVRYEHWQLMAEIWNATVNSQDDISSGPRPLQALICRAIDIEQASVPCMFEGGKMLSRKESALQLPDERWILSGWLFELEGPSIEHWDRLRDAATSFGYGKDAAAYYRAACRESVNHSWHPAAAISLGVYDIPVSTPRLFRQEESDEEFKGRIEGIWRHEEPEAFELS